MRAVKDCDEALAIYRFDQYAKACYDFFWRDFCDWYIEAVKPAMKDPATSTATAAVLSTVLDQTLRLLHPAIPFITETMWWTLNSVRPARGVKDVTAPASERLIQAAWPILNEALIDDTTEAQWNQLQELIVTIRNLRNEHKVDPKKSVRVSIAAPADLCTTLLGERGLIELLATCQLLSAQPDLPSPADSIRATAGNCEIYVQDLVDAQAEAQRIAKLRDDLSKQIDTLKKRLFNAGYIAKAPAHLVQQTRDQLTAAEAELARLDT